MKNPTILKDELSLLRADKSVVLTELRNKGKELKKRQEDIFKAEQKLADVRSEMTEEIARLDDLRDRAILVKNELSVNSQELKNINNSLDLTKTRNSQEVRNHLGRIKELKDEEQELLESISKLKKLFDNNSRVFNEHESERLSRIRDLNASVSAKETELAEVSNTLEKLKAEDKKITKDRLKREDKLRAKEKHLEAKEYAISKREEDLITMSKDMTIVYGRLKELYAKTMPEVDLDKLILNSV